MSESLVWRADKLGAIEEAQVLRRAACPHPNEAERACLEESVKLCREVFSPQVCYRVFPVKIRGATLHFGEYSVPSQKLCELLADSEEVLLFAATVGLAFDRLLQRESRLSPARALFLQAIGTERVEALCDAFLQQYRVREGVRLTRRFSPGYGDLDLAGQRTVFSALSCTKHIGLYLKDSLLMSPAKSVTAFVGVCRKDEEVRGKL